MTAHPIAVTIFSSPRGEKLVKSIAAERDGSIRKAAPTMPSAGTIETRRLPAEGWQRAYAAMLRTARQDQTFGFGMLVHPDAPADGRAALATLATEDPPRSFARSKANFGYRPGRPALLLLDMDTDGMPAALVEKLVPPPAGRRGARDGLPDLLATVEPQFATCGLVRRPSTSAGLSVMGTPVPDAAGEHVVVAVNDGTAIPRLLETLHVRLVLTGFGWTRLSDDGKPLPRGPVDAAVGGAERIVFEGEPVLGPGVHRDPAMREPVIADGPMLNAAAIAPLTEAEREAYARWREAERARLKPQAAAQRETWRAGRVDALRKASVPPERAEATVAAMLAHDELTSAMRLKLHNGRTVNVADILDRPREFHGVYCPDPAEPGAGSQKAIIFTNVDTPERGLPILHSHLHGGANYRLRHDFEAFAERAGTVAQKDGAEALSAWLGANFGLLSKDVTPAQADEMLKRLAKLCGAKVADLRRAVPFMVSGADPERAGRPVLRVDEGWRDRACRNVADALAKTDGIYRQGRRAVRLTDDHAAFGIDDAQAHGAWTESLTPNELAAFADQAFQPMKMSRAGVKQADFPVTWAEHLAKGDFYAPLRALRGITHVPIMRPDGSVHVAEGFDPASGFVYLSRGLVLPDIPAQPTEAEARAAVGKLFELLSTFPLRHAGGDFRANAVALLMTAVARTAMRVCPYFAVSAPKARTGKGMLIRTACKLATGRLVSPTSLAEEPGKRIPSALLGNAPFIFFDNINSVLKSDELCTLATEGAARIRAYGSRDGLELAIYGGMILFNGNGFRAGEDLASRTIVIALDAGSNPGQRTGFPFCPERRVLAERAGILSAVLTIVRWALSLDRPARLPGANGFDEWDRLVRVPLFLLTGDDVLAATFTREAEEEADAGKAALVDALGGHFGERAFTSKEAFVALGPTALGCHDERGAGYRLRALPLHEGTTWKLLSLRGKVGCWRCIRRAEADFPHDEASPVWLS